MVLLISYKPDQPTNFPYIKKSGNQIPPNQLTFLKFDIKLIGTHPWSSMFRLKYISLTKLSLLKKTMCGKYADNFLKQLKIIKDENSD